MSACPNCGYARWLSPNQPGPCNCSPEAIKRASQRVYSDDFKRCDCGSETFARFEVYANPTITVRVHTACGNSWVTRINATEEQARSYFVGKWFNLGTEEDQTVRVVLLEVVSDA